MNALAEQLEQLIDKYSIADVLAVIGDICEVKAEHVLVNWQDEGIALKWQAIAEALSAIDARSL